MTTTSAGIPCPVGSWTTVSAGSASVTVQGPVGGYRVGVGISAPGTLISGIICFDLSGTFALSGLAGTDNVYVTPTGGSAVTVTALTS